MAPGRRRCCGSPRPSWPRRRPGGAARARSVEAGRSGRPPPPARVHAAGARLLPAVHRLRVRGLRRHPEGAPRPPGSATRRCVGCSASSVSTRWPGSTSRRCRAGCAGDWRWHRRCSGGRTCCCSTSRPAASIPSSGSASASWSARSRRATVLLSTHQTEDVTALCQRARPAHGAVRFDGSPAQLARVAEGGWTAAEEAAHGASVSWRTGDGLVRHIGDPPTGATIAPPTLEDGYLLLLAQSEGMERAA